MPKTLKFQQAKEHNGPLVNSYVRNSMERPGKPDGERNNSQ